MKEEMKDEKLYPRAACSSAIEPESSITQRISNFFVLFSDWLNVSVCGVPSIVSSSSQPEVPPPSEPPVSPESLPPEDPPVSPSPPVEGPS